MYPQDGLIIDQLSAMASELWKEHGRNPSFFFLQNNYTFTKTLQFMCLHCDHHTFD